MDDLNEQGEELFTQDGVLVKGQHPIRDDDSQCSGTLSIVEYKSIGKCIEWRKSTEVSVDSEMHDQEWAMVNTVGRRTRTSSGSTDGQARCRPVRIELSDLKSFRITRNSQQVTLMQRDGTTYSAFFFQHGNSDAFVSALKYHLKTARSKRDRHLYMVLDEPATQVLNRSFAELDIFQENTSDVVWRFVRNLHHRPYETTLEAFCKLTDVLLYRPIEQRREEEVAELLNRSLTLDETETNVAGEEYAIINLGSAPVLPPRPLVSRGPPLSVEQWAQFQDEDGKINDVEGIKKIIFRGGIVPQLRYDVWKYLLGYFPWDSTHAERQQIRKQKVEEYFKMKLQWKSFTPGQEQRFSDYRERKNLIEKDVNRTDRTHPFFAGENNPNLQQLYDILMTYVMYNFDLGYVQGMSDLLSPILCLMNNEADSFWCFVGFMDKVSSNFELDQTGMKQQLQQLYILLKVTAPDLTSYLDQHDSGNMFFCFRWLLVLFKREFSYQDIMRLWEVLWTDLPGPNFHLFLCVAILETQQHILMENQYGFTEILKHINDLSMNIDLESTICTADAIYQQLLAASDNLQDAVRWILGLEPLRNPGTSKQNGEVDEQEEATFVENGVKVEDGPESLEKVSFAAMTGEVAFEKSLSNHYL